MRKSRTSIPAWMVAILAVCLTPLSFPTGAAAQEGAGEATEQAAPEPDAGAVDAAPAEAETEVVEPATEQERQALAAAEAWLQLLDSGAYDESWTAAATPFQDAVTQERWKASLEQVRTPLGATSSRTLKGTRHTTTLPNAPEGEYVVIQFATTFENRDGISETVTPMLEDGEWKVSGYYIR